MTCVLLCTGCRGLQSKGERVNLGRFQAAISVAKHTVCYYGLKAYFFNVAAIRLGFHGIDRRAKPATLPAVGDGPASSEGPVTLAAHAKMSFGEACCNQLDRAAWLFGDVMHYHQQRIVVNVMRATSEYHSEHSGPILQACRQVDDLAFLCSKLLACHCRRCVSPWRP